MTVTDASAQESAALADRYGRKPQNRKRNRRLFIGVVAALAAILVAFLVWAGLDQTGSTMESTDVGSTIVNDRAVEVSFQVSMPPGRTATCALQAQNDQHTVIGWKVVDVPASKVRTTSHTETVRTAERAVTGLIYQCWLT